jgi:hypothetical protein
MIKPRVFVNIGFLMLLTSCVRIGVISHPDYKFPPTDPSTVRIYNKMEPTYPYIIIGRMQVNFTWSFSDRRLEQSMAKKAAAIGGTGILITDINVDIYAFNRSVTTSGQASIYGNTVYYKQVSRPNTTYVPVKRLYAYVIRRPKVVREIK